MNAVASWKNKSILQSYYDNSATFNFNNNKIDIPGDI